MDLLNRSKPIEFENGYQNGLNILHDIGVRPLDDKSFSLDEFVDVIDINSLQGIDFDDLKYDVGLATRVYNFVKRYGDDDYANYFDADLVEFLNTYSGQENEVTAVQNSTKEKLRFAEIPDEGSVETVFGTDETRYDLIASVSPGFFSVSSGTNAKTYQVVYVTWKNGKVTQLNLRESSDKSKDYSQVLNEFYKVAAQHSQYEQTEMWEDYERLKKGQHVGTIILGVTSLAIMGLGVSFKFPPAFVLGGLGLIGTAATYYYAYDASNFNSASDFEEALNADEVLKEQFKLNFWIWKHVKH